MKGIGPRTRWVLVIGILASIVGSYYVWRFLENRALQLAKLRAERVLTYFVDFRLKVYDESLGVIRRQLEKIVTEGVLPVRVDLKPNGDYPGLVAVSFSPRTCFDVRVPLVRSEESGWASSSQGHKELIWYFELSWEAPLRETLARPGSTSKGKPPEPLRRSCSGRIEIRIDQNELARALEDDAAASNLHVNIYNSPAQAGARFDRAMRGGRDLTQRATHFCGNDIILGLAPSWMDMRLRGTAVLVGEVLTVFGVYQIVKARYRRRLWEAQRAIEFNQRVAAIGELAVAISHELMQPLSGAIACLDAAELKGELNPAGEGLKALRHIERATAILDDIRNQVKPSPAVSKPAPVELEPLLRKLIDLTKLDSRFRPVGIVLTLPLEPLWVKASAIGLESVLLNLLRNSAEAIASVGRSGSVEILAEAKGTAITISVLDDGPGIANPDRLFRPFLSEKREGMGLGLSYCRRMVQSWGGTLTGQNRPEGGALFQLELHGIPGNLIPKFISTQRVDAVRR